MQVEKANQLNAFIYSAIRTYNKVCQKSNDNQSISNEIKIQYHEAEFEDQYQEFLAELRDNINEYGDINILLEYTHGCLNYVYIWEGFNPEEIQWIISNGFEMNFLIKLNQSITNIVRRITPFFSIYPDKEGGVCLKSIYDEEMEIERNGGAFVEVIHLTDTLTLEMGKNERFDFQNLKKECELLINTVEKIKLINDRLYDFEIPEK